MPIKTVTFFGELLKLARAMAEAEESGDQQRFLEAKARHDEYARLCAESNEMSLSCDRKYLARGL